MSREPNARLKTLIQAAGLSPAQLARALRALAAEQDLSVSYDYATVRRWLEGARPRPPAPALLVECLSRRLGRPVTAQEAGLTHAPAVTVDPAWQADPLRKLAQLTSAELDPARQRLLGADGFSLTALAIPDPLPSSAPADRPAPAGPDGAHPGSTESDHLHGMALHFNTAAEEYGGEPVRAALAAFLTHHVVPVLHTEKHERSRRSVLSASAQLTILLGLMSADSGHDRTAQHYHHIAARFAADAGDCTTLAIALRTMASHAYELGYHTPTVLHLSEQAAKHASAAPPAVQAYTHANLAVLQAYYDPRAALDTLALAERLHARADGPPGPFTAYPVSALYYQRAQTLSILGDRSGSVNALKQSLHMRSPAEHRAAVLTRARLAAVHMSIGHLEKALFHWQAFLTAYPTLHSARATRQLHTLREQLRPFQRHRAARQLLNQARLLA
ncbi:hypothetical protein [Streptomyces sp. AK02-04a]|uniref:hypothetical protein n=1 Tax=Streptomyces sp. AK02-04a TaxID=3028649 RepID=UPI0029AFCAE2|nr:hypothetical protein [Streptomyces sp. AK02-04a]MDX3763973.1 hypothetical protein [Streptomyces sp. AK02-04a]